MTVTYSWVGKLPSYFEHAGFISIADFTYPYPTELLTTFTQVNLLADQEFSYKAYENGGPESNGSKYRALLNEAYERADRESLYLIVQCHSGKEGGVERKPTKCCVLVKLSSRSGRIFLRSKVT